ncbi:MAG: hypothetical protein A3K09_04080 [Nitrospinae bacterium RIFCSPLOWO2_12_FULL_47_7]|nr:MAG: hypothetical protein A3K09_04080 [Nitrospinae bacterium RIFCSPLOWO2_12_FULL_47_7]
MSKNKKHSIWILLILTAYFPLVASGCSGKSNTAPTGLSESAVIEINGEAISREKYIKALKALKQRYRLENSRDFSPDQLLWLKSDVTNEIILDVLFQQEVAKNSIKISDEELKRNLQQMMNDYQEDSFQRYLEIENISLQEWQNKLKNNLLIKSLINKVVNSKVSISDSETQEYFKAHPEEFQTKERIRALHIMVETEEEARNILKKMASGKKDFSHLAQEHSLGPEGVKGGDLGYFESGNMPEEFDDIFKLNVNETSAIIRSPYGFHIFKVIDKKNHRKMSFDESRKLIYNKLLQQHQEKAFQEWLKKIKDDASIKINYDILAQIE